MINKEDLGESQGGTFKLLSMFCIVTYSDRLFPDYISFI